MSDISDQFSVTNSSLADPDPTAEDRKKDHIELAFKSRVESNNVDDRFYFDPLFTAHPISGSLPVFPFLGKMMRVPIWVSSMTGGTQMAATINKNLARACGEYGLGMGLGSCRQLLFSDEFLPDFAVRKLIGDQPFYANLGVAQLEELIEANNLDKIVELNKKLETDGLIIHVNPMQEWMQPEGDRFKQPPLDTIKRVLDHVDFPVIVKEVGQGFGPESLKELLKLPLAAVDFASSGGTNFALLELLRSEPQKLEWFESLTKIGHSASEMVGFVNQVLPDLGDEARCPELIISGGISDFLEGYYLISKVDMPAIYGQASAFLKHAFRKSGSQSSTMISTVPQLLPLPG